MKLKDLLKQLTEEFDTDSETCTCEECVILRPQVALLRNYLKKRRVDKNLMRAITKPDLKQALIEEICLYSLRTEED